MSVDLKLLFEINKSNSKFKPQNMNELTMKEWTMVSGGICQSIRLAFWLAAQHLWEKQFWAAVSGFVGGLIVRRDWCSFILR